MFMRVYSKFAILALGCLLLGGIQARADDVSVADSEIAGEALSDGLVKLTWEAEIENDAADEAEVTVTLELLNAAGDVIDTFTIQQFSVGGKTTQTAVQSRPISASVWASVDSHSVTVSR